MGHGDGMTPPRRALKSEKKFEEKETGRGGRTVIGEAKVLRLGGGGDRLTPKRIPIRRPDDVGILLAVRSS